MDCNDFKNMIVVSIYGKLTSSEKSEFEEHLRDCPKCARLYRKTERYHGLFEEKEEMPLPSWEKSWETISERAIKRKKRAIIRFPYRKYALTAAAIIAVFVIGIYAGRHLFIPKSDISQFESEPDYSHARPIRYYAENLEPVLINFMNRSYERNGEEFPEIEKQVIVDMLEQTRLLKRLLSGREDPLLQYILEDLEFILVSISNMRPGDRDSADQLNQFIREKELRFKLHQLASEKSFI